MRRLVQGQKSEGGLTTLRICADYIIWFKIVDRLPLRLQIKALKLADWLERRRA